jgi:GntR family transcriptional regulator, transcriptional repressor for pyruvate dehydrogenase complex
MTESGSSRRSAPARATRAATAAEPASRTGAAKGRPRASKRSDLIAEEMKRWIFVDKKQPGDRLPQEHELAALFKASRWTIREALKSLEVQGLISVSSGASGGARIADVSLENAVQLLANYFYFKPLSIQHIYSLRKVLEPMLAVETVDHLTEQHLRALAANVETTRLSPRNEDERREHRTAELAFHNILADACPNPVLSFICRFINDVLKDWVVFNRTYVEDSEQFTHENLDYHAALLDAFQRRDRAAVARLMAEHMDQAACHTVEMNCEIEVKFLPK